MTSIHGVMSPNRAVKVFDLNKFFRAYYKIQLRLACTNMNNIQFIILFTN